MDVLDNEAELRYKIAQMFIIGFEGQTLHQDHPLWHDMQVCGLGGVVLFDVDAKTKRYAKNIASAAQLKDLTAQLQQANKQLHHWLQRETLPLLISMDYEGGKVSRLREACGFPATLSAQHLSKEGLLAVQAQAKQMAGVLRDLGINLNFAPVVDVNLNPFNPVIAKLERSFSNQPDTVANYALAFAAEFAAKGILSTYKHFPGHGSSRKDSHLGLVDITETWHKQEWYPYTRLLANQQWPSMVMMGHLIHRQLDPLGWPASMSSKMMQALRDTFAFEGVIVSDDMQMHAISEHYGFEEALFNAINGGANLLIYGNQLASSGVSIVSLVDAVLKAIKTGHIAYRRIESSYEKIMGVKRWLASNG